MAFQRSVKKAKKNINRKTLCYVIYINFNIDLFDEDFGTFTDPDNFPLLSYSGMPIDIEENL